MLFIQLKRCEINNAPNIAWWVSRVNYAKVVTSHILALAVKMYTGIMLQTSESTVCTILITTTAIILNEGVVEGIICGTQLCHLVLSLGINIVCFKSESVANFKV